MPSLLCDTLPQLAPCPWKRTHHVVCTSRLAPRNLWTTDGAFNVDEVSLGPCGWQLQSGIISRNASTSAGRGESPSSGITSPACVGLSFLELEETPPRFNSCVSTDFGPAVSACSKLARQLCTVVCSPAMGSCSHSTLSLFAHAEVCAHRECGDRLKSYSFGCLTDRSGGSNSKLAVVRTAPFFFVDPT